MSDRTLIQKIADLIDPDELDRVIVAHGGDERVELEPGYGGLALVIGEEDPAIHYVKETLKDSLNLNEWRGHDHKGSTLESDIDVLLRSIADVTEMKAMLVAELASLTAELHHPTTVTADDQTAAVPPPPSTPPGAIIQMTPTT